MSAKQWRDDDPPNEQIVEVKTGRRVIRVMAFYGRDGYLPHWRSEDGAKYWEVSAFRQWRPVLDVKE